MPANTNLPESPPVAPSWLRRHRTRLFIGYLVLAILLFGILFISARTIPYFAYDVSIERSLQSVPLPGLQALMVAVSWLGFAPVPYFLVGGIIIYLFVIQLRWEAVMALFASVGIIPVGNFIKDLIARPRPSTNLVSVYSALPDFSFPSNHVLLFTSFLGFLWFLLYVLGTPSWQRTLGLVVTGALIILVGISRIYLGHHWPTDVLAGYLLGSLWLALTIWLYRRGKARFLALTSKIGPLF